MISAPLIRKQVRLVLSAVAADRSLNEPFILEGLRRFFPEEISAEELMAALQWNEARGWVERRWNAEYERTEWLLTRRGRTQEGLA